MASVQRAVTKKRGIAVLMAVFFMILLSLIGIALIGMVPVELQSSTRTKLDVQAHYAATSGIRHAKAWCSAVMTPSTDSASPNYLGDPGSNTFGTSYCTYPNEIVAMDGTKASVEYTAMQLKDVFGSSGIPTGTTRWADVYQMLNIPASGDTAVDGNTIVMVKKAPLVLGDWSTYVVIIPDIDSPGGLNTLDPSTKNTVVRAFGGSGNSVTGSRCYEMIALTYYQGFPTLRAKSTQLETTFGRYAIFVDHDQTNGGWALQANGGQTTTEGPVHTNESFKFAVNPNVWTDTSGKVPFNGLMTFAKYADASTGVDVNKNFDGALYSNGNIASGAGQGTDPNYRPFDDAGQEVNGRYSKLISGGKSNLRLAPTTKLPPDSNKLANAAYGTNYNFGNYKVGAASAAINTNGPDGLFVFPNSLGKVAGGVVVKGNQKNMFMEVVNATGRPMGVDTVNSTGGVAVTATDLAGLKDGSAAGGNPALRVQSEKSATSTSVITTTGWSTSSSVSRATLTTGSTFVASTITQSTSTGTHISSGSAVQTLYGSSTLTTSTPRVTTSTQYSTGVSTITGRTATVLTTGTSYTTVGAAGGVVQPVPLTSTSTITNLTPTTTSVSTGQVVSTTGWSTGTSVTSSSTGTTINSSSRVITDYVTNFTPTSTLRYLTTVSRSTSLTSVLTTVYNTVTDTYNPIDQLIEAKNSAVTLSPSMFVNNGSGNYKRAAGAFGSGSDMDVSHLNITQMMLADAAGNLTPMPATKTVNKGEVVVIKQSRTDPTQAVVFILPADAQTDGSLLNGSVFAEGNLGSTQQGGVSGVNYGRKSIGTQIRDTANTNTYTDPFDKNPTATSKLMGIANNVWQFGTNPNETDKTLFKADNGLGLVSENINVNAKLNDFTNFSGGNISPAWGTDKILNIHAIIMGGSGNGGGLTVQGFTDVNSLTSGNLGSSAGQTPLVRFVGGLILQNYYGRINGITQAGWNSMNIYNQQLALSPPPWFPNDGRLAPLSYMEERVWGDHR